MAALILIQGERCRNRPPNRSLGPVSMTFDDHAMVQPAVPLPRGERSDRACAIRVRGISFTSSNPLTRNGREAPIPTSPLRGEVELLARSQRNTLWVDRT